MEVIKRDGRKQEFSCVKVYTAIVNACEAVDKEITEESKELAFKISKAIGEMNKTMTVEEIQDIIEKKLMSSSRKDVAKAYII